ncbi:MAG: type II CRISPR RNA-guided endonuclease Cas9 [Bacteroidales bacterium]
MKTLGLDLGTNSIGAALRDLAENENPFSWYGVTIFDKGVGEGKSGEYSYAAERTKNRAVRRLVQARKYRLWATLEVLIKTGYCPMTIESLDKWRKYDKKAGLAREYPIDDLKLDAWIKLDFDNNGIPDYSSPYQLRFELINKKLNLSDEISKFKIGRAFYHIAQRRGFKSSRKSGDKENTSVYNGSKESGAKGVNEIIELITEHGTLGAALAIVEKTGQRIRNQYTLRKHYQEEIEKIASYQNLPADFLEKINKAIFFQRPLRSQKGLVGNCTLEPTKPRCPISHPAYEEFRALAFINNIYYNNSSFKIFN